MSNDCIRTLTHPGEDGIVALARQTGPLIPHTLREQDTPDAREDLEQAWLRYVQMYFEMLTEQRSPTFEEIAEFEAVARRRFHQSVELVALQRAFRAGARILLSIALQRVDPVEAGIAASYTLRFEDIMATAAERAYLDEQLSLAETQTDIAADVVLKMLRRQISADDPSLRSLSTHGFDFARPYTTVDISTTKSPVEKPNSDSRMDKALTALRGLLPFALQVRPSSDQALLFVPGDSIGGLARLLTDLTMNRRDFHDIRVGISQPHAGIGSLLVGHDEATRARAVGEVLHPNQRVHAWEELRLIDIFAAGETIPAFVDDVLGPLAEMDSSRGTQLVKTLAVYFETNGNRKAAAEKLNVHINTLDYRIRQAWGLLGEELAADTFGVQLAIRLYPLCTSNMRRTNDAVPST